VKVLLVSGDPRSREAMQMAVAGVQSPGEVEFLEATNGERGVALAWEALPEVVIADEIVSRAGAFSLAHDLRGAPKPFDGRIIILLERAQDAWLAEWSGADAWFVKPVDPLELSAKVRELVAEEAA